MQLGALLLSYSGSKPEDQQQARAVAIAFGLTASPMYRWMKFGRKLLLFALQHHPAAKVCLPNEEETQQYVNAIAAKDPGNWIKQNQYYNGWTCGHAMVFAIDTVEGKKANYSDLDH
eukprot:jgi/Psemu1/34235/gm1.34235_g